MPLQRRHARLQNREDIIARQPVPVAPGVNDAVQILVQVHRDGFRVVARLALGLRTDKGQVLAVHVAELQVRHVLGVHAVGEVAEEPVIEGFLCPLSCRLLLKCPI